MIPALLAPLFIRLLRHPLVRAELREALAEAHAESRESIYPTAEELERLAALNRLIWPRPGGNQGEVIHVRATLDPSALRAVLPTLVQLPDGLVQLLDGGVHLCEARAETLPINADAAPAGFTHELRVTLDPSECALDLVAAVRAGHVNLPASVKESQDSPPSGSSLTGGAR